MTDNWLVTYWTQRANLSAMTEAQLWQFTLMLDSVDASDRMTEAVLLMDDTPVNGVDYSQLDPQIITRAAVRRGNLTTGD